MGGVFLFPVIACDRIRLDNILKAKVAVACSSTIAPIGLYSWRRWDDNQPIAMLIPMPGTPTGLSPSARENNF
ncbi:MAG: hypothetical protein TE42_03660 [Candidatus Synechococcus spongiarum SP3]|uniref:Uncharacterized protein n=1 Tax=Candidatus Synechococcus spongiarum SP3 TaxID=1604020 RepID=A0A0G2IWK2_9SYNE|nr:MAG: hypothetical protein TE42_03660 [Candidatus Synechococcus spongiarum SP3]